MSQGIEKGALYIKTEQYLREYNSMQARIKNLELDLKQIKEWTPELPEQIIEGLTFAKNNLDGMPIASGISDKTASVAVRYRLELDQCAASVRKETSRDLENMEHEKSILESRIQKIDNAILSLSEDERIIVRGFYIEQKPWYDIAHEVQYVERHCKRLRTRAIWYMSKSIFGVGKVSN